MAAALDWLLEESRTRQILLFTCHRREGDYLWDRAHVAHGLIGEAGDVLKHTDDLAFVAKTSGKNADEVVSATAKKSKSFIDEDRLQATKEAISNVKKADPIGQGQ